MKKTVLAAAVCAALLTLAACGKKTDTPLNGATSGNTSGLFGDETSGQATSSSSSSSSQQSSSSSALESKPVSSAVSSAETSAPESVPEESSAPEDNAADFRTEEITNDDGTETICIIGYTGNDEQVVIPETIGGKKVTHIGGNAFEGNIDITSVTIPDSVEWLYTNIHRNSTFSGCKNLNEVIFLGNDAPAFDKDTFSQTPWLEAKLAENPDYIEVNNTLVRWLSSAGDVVVPDGITKIGAYAFWEDSDMGSISLPDSVTEIGFAAFCLCSKLESITLPDSVTEIGAYAFLYCRHLESVKLPAKITEIAAGTFSNCLNLEALNIPNGVTAIGENVFYDVGGKISLPDSVKTLGKCEFFYSEITYKGETYKGQDGYNELRELIASQNSNAQ